MLNALYSIGMTDAMITSSVITIILCAIAIIASRRLEMIPTGLQNVIEMAVGKLNSFFKDIMGEYACKRYFPIVATLFIYILICNYSGLLPLAGEVKGFKPPTGDINFPLALALTLFVALQIIGMREQHGLRYYKHFLKPVAFIFPLMIIEELVRPVSLTFRLYGNISGEEAVVAAFNDIFPVGLAVIMQFLSVLMGLIQALVFSLLAAIYIAEAAEHEEEQLPVHEG